MNNISTLLQEAKPLYKKRKQQRKKIQACCIALFCLGVFSWNYPSSDLNFNIEEELYLTETGGYIENLGLPTDDLGLLKVS